MSSSVPSAFVGSTRDVQAGLWVDIACDRPDINAHAVSERVAATIANGSRDRAARVLVELENRGWIEVLRVGTSDAPIVGLPALAQ